MEHIYITAVRTNSGEFRYGDIREDTFNPDLINDKEEFYEKLVVMLKKDPAFERAVKRHTTNYLHEAGYKLLTPENKVIPW